MNEFARYGFDCWTMDHANYGKSGRTSVVHRRWEPRVGAKKISNRLSD